MIAPTILSGYTYPSDAPYVTVNTQEMGIIDIYFPSNQVEYIHVDRDRNIIISSYTGTVYGYASNDLRISWSIYSLPYYTTTGSYQNQTLNITEIIEDHLTDNNTRAIVRHNYEVITLALIGGLILLLFFKK